MLGQTFMLMMVNVLFCSPVSLAAAFTLRTINIYQKKIALLLISKPYLE